MPYMGQGTDNMEIGNPILDALKARHASIPPMLETLMQMSANAAPRPGEPDRFGFMTGPGGFSSLLRKHETEGPWGVDPM